MAVLELQKQILCVCVCQSLNLNSRIQGADSYPSVWDLCSHDQLHRHKGRDPLPWFSYYCIPVVGHLCISWQGQANCHQRLNQPQIKAPKCDRPLRSQVFLTVQKISHSFRHKAAVTVNTSYLIRKYTYSCFNISSLRKYTRITFHGPK
jgi:hypothetical protein